MKNTNKRRLLALLRILKKKSDEENHLNLSYIATLIKEEDIEAPERKTFYEDIRLLQSEGYEIERDHKGYYLSEAPFSLCEIKLLLDSISSLKSIDERMAASLFEKLYSFVSEKEEKFLREISYNTSHQNTRFLQSLEDVLLALKHKTAVKIVRNSLKEEEIFPVFIHRDHDYYYLYYHYADKNKIYHFRFDTLKSVVVTDVKDQLEIKKEDILKLITSSSSSYTSGNQRTIRLEVSDPLSIRYLQEEFPGTIVAKDSLYISCDVNPQLFGRLFAYGDKIKILDPQTKAEYKEYLNKIMTIYH